MKSYITQEDLERLAEFSAKVGVDAYREEAESEGRRRKREYRRMTINLCRSYKRTKHLIEQETHFTEEEKSEMRWKFLKGMMEDPQGRRNIDQMIVEDEEKRRQRDLYGIHRIETALDLFRKECDLSPDPEPKRWYRVFMMRYVNEPEMPIESIMEAEDISESTAKRDIRNAADIISTYLFGIY